MLILLREYGVFLCLDMLLWFITSVTYFSSWSTPSVRLTVCLSIHITLNCIVCVICYYERFQSYIQTLKNDCSHIEDVHPLFCAHFMNMFILLRGVGHRHSICPSAHPQHIYGSRLCNFISNSSHSFIFKRFIMICHTLKMCNSYFVHIS